VLQQQPFGFQSSSPMAGHTWVVGTALLSVSEPYLILGALC